MKQQAVPAHRRGRPLADDPFPPHFVRNAYMSPFGAPREMRIDRSAIKTPWNATPVASTPRQLPKQNTC